MVCLEEKEWTCVIKKIYHLEEKHHFRSWNWSRLYQRVNWNAQDGYNMYWTWYGWYESMNMLSNNAYHSVVIENTLEVQGTKLISDMLTVNTTMKTLNISCLKQKKTWKDEVIIPSWHPAHLLKLTYLTMNEHMKTHDPLMNREQPWKGRYQGTVWRTEDEQNTNKTGYQWYVKKNLKKDNHSWLETYQVMWLGMKEPKLFVMHLK